LQALDLVSFDQLDLAVQAFQGTQIEAEVGEDDGQESDHDENG
jgi:hypothetical protein